MCVCVCLSIHFTMCNAHWIQHYGRMWTSKNTSTLVAIICSQNNIYYTYIKVPGIFFLLLRTVQYILKLFKFPFHPPKFVWHKMKKQEEKNNKKKKNKWREREKIKTEEWWATMRHSNTNNEFSNSIYAYDCTRVRAHIHDCKLRHYPKNHFRATHSETHIFLSTIGKIIDSYIKYYVNSWYVSVSTVFPLSLSLFLSMRQRKKFIWSL